jgi:hypothetical protein
MHAAGGPDAFFEDYAVIVVSDHSQAPVEERIRLVEAFADFDVATQSASRSVGAEIAISPAQRSAMIYALDEEHRDELVRRSVQATEGLEGVDLVMWCERNGSAEGVVRSARGELHFAPGGDLTDDRGRSWSVEGDLAALGATANDGRFACTEYPDALARVWSALQCPTAGDVLLSAAPGYEFVDWGGADHVGGGSHGSLHRSDSLGVLLWSGMRPSRAKKGHQYAITDVAPMVLEHFGVGFPAGIGQQTAG